MSKRIRVYVNPSDVLADAFRAALITHPAKFDLVDNAAAADVAAHQMMPAGSLATWITSYFVADAEIDAADLEGKTIEISIETEQALTPEEREAEALSVLGALGIARLEKQAVSRTANSLMIAGFWRGSSVSIAHRSVVSGKARLYISITDLKLQVVLDAPMGKTALAAEISGHSAEGTHKLRPLYRSAISRWLANYQL